jgi:hypothetical protein
MGVFGISMVDNVLRPLLLSGKTSISGLSCSSDYWAVRRRSGSSVWSSARSSSSSPRLLETLQVRLS